MEGDEEDSEFVEKSWSFDSFAPAASFDDDAQDDDDSSEIDVDANRIISILFTKILFLQLIFSVWKEGKEKWYEEKSKIEQEAKKSKKDQKEAKEKRI